MKSISPDAIGIVLGTLALLFGQAAEAISANDVGNLVQGGAFAVLAYTLLHLVTKTLPRRDKDYADMVQRITERYSSDLDRQAARATEAQGEIARAITDLRVHCAEQLKRERVRLEENARK